MASAAITIVESPATIESDGNEATITKHTAIGDGFTRMEGMLRNHGPADVFLSVSVTPGTAPAAVAITGAQAQLQVPLPAGATLPWLFHYAQVSHKTAGGLATLSWVPHHAARRG